jgi:hypothetical protein
MTKTIDQRAFGIVLGAWIAAACSGTTEVTHNGASSAHASATGGSDFVPTAGTSSGGTISSGIGGAPVVTTSGGSMASSAGGSTASSTGGSTADPTGGGSGSGGSVAIAGSGGAAGAAGAAPINVLVFNYATGFGHQTRESAIPLLQTAAAANNINLDLKYAILKDRYGNNYIPEGTSDLFAGMPVDLSAFTPGGLDEYDVIFFLNTSGHVFQGADELIHQEALQDYMDQHHGGFVGTLSATDTYDEGWQWYQDMIGSIYNGFSPVTGGSARWKDGVSHAILTSAMVPNPWARDADLWFDFRRDVSDLPGFTVLLLATETGGSERESAWVHELPGGGRVFYTAFGHTVATFQDPVFITFLMTGIKWAAHRM